MKNALLVAALMLTGCGVSQTEETGPDALDTEGNELSASSRSYVTFQRDFRKCASPMCGGFFVTDVNRVNPTPKYVTALDFKASGLDQKAIDEVLGAELQNVVLRGKLGAPITQGNTLRPFIVSDAFRGMPGVTAVAGQPYFKVESINVNCIKAPCPTMKATKLNAGGSTMIDGLSVADASLTRVDHQWLGNRVAEHGALLTAKVINGQLVSGTYEKILSGSQVFVKLPEVAGPCPLVKMPPCPNGKVRTYERNEDRCVLPSFTCVTGGACAQFVPVCDPGYELQSWTGGNFACTVYACDPQFSL